MDVKDQLRVVRIGEKSEARDDVQLRKLFMAAAEDDDYKKIVDALRAEEEPKKLAKDHPSRRWTDEWHELSLSDDRENPLIVFKGSRIVVPKMMRGEILWTLHLPHFSTKKTVLTGKLCYAWPGMASEIKSICENCQVCQKYSPSRKREEYRMDKKSLIDLTPMECIAVDFFKAKGSDHLAVVDRASGFVWCKKMKPVTKNVTDFLEDLFIEHGCATSLRSDGGPQFRKTFGRWCAEMGVNHELSSAYNPESNGLSEASVKRLKHLYLKTNNAREFKVALVQMNAMEREDGSSPSTIFQKGVVRCQLPSLRIPVDLEKAKASREEAAQKMRKAAGGVAPRKEFIRGDEVVIQDHKSKRWTGRGVIAEILREGHRSYFIDTDSGVKLRNGKFLKKPVDSAQKVTGCGAGLRVRSCMKGARLTQQRSRLTQHRGSVSVGPSLAGAEQSAPGLSASGSPREGVRFAPKVRVTGVDNKEPEEVVDIIFKEDRPRPQRVSPAKRKHDGRRSK